MAARRGRGSTAVHVIFSQHAEILQYSRKTITGRFRATDRLDTLYTTAVVPVLPDLSSGSPLQLYTTAVLLNRIYFDTQYLDTM